MIQHDVDSLYDLIFDISFLVRYGYYDTSMKKIHSDYIDDSELESYYGKPDSFYLKIFNMKDLAALLQSENFSQFYNLKKIKNNPGTEPMSFNIPKSKYTRREYKMPNIYSYIELSLFISENKDEFINTFKSNIQSTSKFFNQLDFNFEFTKKIEQKLLFGGTKILSLDLSNFYHTLYTHSIPWVINGKQESKATRFGGFGNTLDNIIQHCQYGETHGIPTGNLASRIIAELYMCKIDEILLKKNYKYSRYVDDFKFPFTFDGEKESFLMDFSEVCRDFNLLVNDKKTEVNEFPFNNNMEKTGIFSYFDNYSNITSLKKWRKGINQFIDHCLDEESRGNKGAIKCIFSVISNTLSARKMEESIINSILSFRETTTDFNLYERLLDISLKDSRLSNKFIAFTEILLDLGFKKKKLVKIVKKYFDDYAHTYKSKLNTYINNKWNQELYQLLLYCVVFENSNFISKTDVKNILTSKLDDYTACLCIMIWLKREWNISELLKILENLLTEVHSNYSYSDDKESIRMKEKFWFLRYFVYSLINENIISDVDLQKHFEDNNCKKQQNGMYKSELNQEYTLPINSNVNINKFYNLVLNKKVHLVQLGKDKDFKYI